MDRIPQLLTTLLECAEANLSVPVCRTFINPGRDAAWDSCETSDDGASGQLWVAHLWTMPDWPQPTGLPKPCDQLSWAAQIELGIARCQLAKTTDDGGPPPPELVTMDAAQQQLDRFELLRAMTCCWKVEGRDLVFDRWEALEPSGGCVVSRWTVKVRVGTCGC